MGAGVNAVGSLKRINKDGESWGKTAFNLGRHTQAPCSYTHLLKCACTLSVLSLAHPNTYAHTQRPQHPKQVCLTASSPQPASAMRHYFKLLSLLAPSQSLPSKVTSSTPSPCAACPRHPHLPQLHLYVFSLMPQSF